jgi:hypothetical protein
MLKQKVEKPIDNKLFEVSSKFSCMLDELATSGCLSDEELALLEEVEKILVTKWNERAET